VSAKQAPLRVGTCYDGLTKYVQPDSMKQVVSTGAVSRVKVLKKSFPKTSVFRKATLKSPEFAGKSGPETVSRKLIQGSRSLNRLAGIETIRVLWDNSLPLR
jgi:hypothetical protein